MARRMQTLIALLAVPALLAAPAAAIAATAKTRVIPATRIASIRLGGSGGRRVRIDAQLSRRPRLRSVTASAIGPGHENVGYSVRGRATPAGTIDAKFPGVGRVALRFEQTAEETQHYERQLRCSGFNQTITRKGFFRGSIDLHEKDGYVTAERASAPGTIVEYPSETCPRRKHHRQATKEGAEELIHTTHLFADRTVDGGTLSFGASSLEPSGPPAGTRTPSIEFTAGYFGHRHGMTIFASTQVEGTVGDFTISSPDGTPSEATLTPPAPFEGSAALRVESPTETSWTGDLRVEIPILGEVELTGPAFGSQVCDGSSCAGTSPSGSRGRTTVTVSLLG